MLSPVLSVTLGVQERRRSSKPPPIPTHSLFPKSLPFYHHNPKHSKDLLKTHFLPNQIVVCFLVVFAFPPRGRIQGPGGAKKLLTLSHIPSTRPLIP